MQQEFSKQFMIDNRGCYSEEHLNSLSFMQKDTVRLTDILNSGIPLRDKYWFVCRKLARKEQNQGIAISVAEIVFPIFEKRYPNKKEPKEAIEAARQFIAGHVSIEVLIEKRRAAAAAAYAADAAAAAAAYAADAADAADADAADAAYAAAAAAAYAADAAADAADAAAIKKQLLDFLLTFCLSEHN